MSYPFRSAFLAGLCLVLAPLAALAQGSGEAVEGDCQSLRRLTSGELSINTAERVPASDEREAHCRVTGHILPDVGFVVLLPDEWNGGFLMQGNGGFAGRLPRWPDYIPDGFVLAGTDTGHDADRSPLASFGTDRQKVIDFAYRAVHVTAEAAKRIMVAYYGTRPGNSYFAGCSTGGRQGLMAAQRFPGDFDGILVGAPVLNETGTHLRHLYQNRAMLDGPLEMEQMDLLAERVYATCDTVDGVDDGLVAEPTRCGFDPARDLPRCEGEGGSDCFTNAEINTLSKIYGDMTVDGETMRPGLPVGAEMRGLVVGGGGRRWSSGWFGWIVRPEGKTLSLTLAESFLRYLAFPAPDPDYDWHTFDFEKDPQRMTRIRNILDATETDLSAFRDQGGKILMYFGWADPALNPRMGTKYYEEVLSTMGESTPDFFRLFMIPGMFHCRGGVDNPTFDRFAPLQEWVEQGTAPDRLKITYHNEDGDVVRTRPACPYPKVARPTGEGSTEEADDFTCVAPE